MKKHLNIMKKYKYEIMIGILTTTIYEVILKIIKIIPQSGKTILEKCKNFFIKESAVITSIDIVTSVLSFVLGIMFAIIMSIALFSLLKNKIIKYKDKKELYEQKEKAEKCMKISGTILTVLMPILFLSYIFQFNCIIAKNNFEKNLLEIKPYISEQKYDELHSEWIQMENYEDYENIEKEIIKIQEINKLKKIKILP